MPTNKQDVEKFFIKIAILETQMKAVMVFQKVQMGVLVAILLMAVKTWFR